jgi:hypothetical protein
MDRKRQQKLIKIPKFDYWLHNGRHPGKGELQRFIDKLPAITNTILQGNDLMLKDQKIIYDAMGACSDLEIMTANWPERISQFTPEQVTQAESNKSEVEALIARVRPLLHELQNACVARRLSWAEVKKSITRNVDHSRRNRGGNRGVTGARDLEMLLHREAAPARVPTLGPHGKAAPGVPASSASPES